MRAPSGSARSAPRRDTNKTPAKPKNRPTTSTRLRRPPQSQSMSDVQSGTDPNRSAASPDGTPRSGGHSHSPRMGTGVRRWKGSLRFVAMPPMDLMGTAGAAAEHAEKRHEVKQHVIDLVVRGTLGRGSRVPSILDLARTLDVAKN